MYPRKTAPKVVNGVVQKRKFKGTPAPKNLLGLVTIILFQNGRRVISLDLTGFLI